MLDYYIKQWKDKLTEKSREQYRKAYYAKATREAKVERTFARMEREFISGLKQGPDSPFVISMFAWDSSIKQEAVEMLKQRYELKDINPKGFVWVLVPKDFTPIDKP